jgi:hypothetical protein
MPLVFGAIIYCILFLLRSYNLVNTFKQLQEKLLILN